MYVDQINERLAYFVVARRDMDEREEICADSNLETSRMGGKIDALGVVVTKVEGERENLKDHGV